MASGSLDVGRLRLLREVRQRGSIAGAARAVGLTPSAVSQQLTVLEREAGTALIDRSSRGVSLTGAGHLLAVRAGEVADVLAAARADLDRLAGATAGPVRIAAVASAAATLVSAAVTALRADAPGIAVSVVAAEPTAALDLLLAGDVDVAVVDEYDYVPLALPEFVVARELCVEPLVAVMPTGSLDAAARAWAASSSSASADVRLADLAEAFWVMPPEGAACGQAVRSACRALGFEPVVRWETDDMLLLARAVADGHGIAVLPRRSVAEGLAGIAIRPLRRPAIQRRLLAAARRPVLARPAVAAVVAGLADAV